MSVSLILLIVALVLFIIEGFKIWAHPRLNLVVLGLACWVGASVFNGLAS